MFETFRLIGNKSVEIIVVFMKKVDFDTLFYVKAIDCLIKRFTNMKAMKTKVLLVALLSGFAFYLSAQEFQPMEGWSSDIGAKTNFKKNKASDNWFISFAGGASILLGDENGNAKFKDRLNFAPQFSFGKWFNPYTGFRAQFTGNNIHGYSGSGNSLRLLHNKYVAGHVDILWDLSNYWAPYSESRVFRLIPWVGMGYAHRFSNQGYKASDVPTMNAGILMAFRVSKRIDINVEAQGLVTPEYFNDIKYRGNLDLISTLSAGFTVKLGKTDFEVIEPMDYDMLNDLNGQINRLRAENDQLSRRPVSCPECPEIIAAEEVVNIVDNVVYFQINSSKIDKNQEINIFNTSEFIKNNNAPITVVGYADKDTGTSAYNMQLSEKRAKAVAKQLMDKYNIPSNMITIQWKGSDVQPYGTNNWNRVVIMQAE